MTEWDNPNESLRRLSPVRQESRPVIPVLVGPTASGKTALSLRLYERDRRIEIISADSRQIYIGMDIGTAKPSMEFRRAIPHHLIDILSPDRPYSAGQFARDAGEAIASILERGNIPLIVGGTGFYIRALFEGLAAPAASPEIYRQLEARMEREGYASLLEEFTRVDPEGAALYPPENRVKTLRALACYYQTGIPYSQFRESDTAAEARYIPRILCLMPNRDLLYEGINRRVLAMMSEGLVEETRRLVAEGYSGESPGMKTVGYKEILALLKGEMTEEEAVAAIRQATRRYAKRQMTWFRNQLPNVRYASEPDEEGGEWLVGGGANDEL